ncbi:MAG: hypothetical protein NZM11_12290, partial [Anaerolineales bacterium]|nr:hypothetical protein [Anaerolineales bacterium]
MPFKVIIADNFHYMNESENYEYETFDSLELAIEAAKRIVDEYLASAYKPTMTAKELYSSYMIFGKEPYIIAVESCAVPASASPILFSAQSYARERCDM